MKEESPYTVRVTIQADGGDALQALMAEAIARHVVDQYGGAVVRAELLDGHNVCRVAYVYERGQVTAVYD